MPALIIPMCQADGWKTLDSLPIPTEDGVERGEVMVIENTVVFVFARAIPADVIGMNDPNIEGPDLVIAGAEDIYVPVFYCEKAKLVNLTTTTADEIPAGADVFFDIALAKPHPTHANTNCVWIGTMLSDLNAGDIEGFIEFDGRNKSRTHS